MQRQANKIERHAIMVNSQRKGYTHGAKRMLGREVTRGQRRLDRLEVASALTDIEVEREEDYIALQRSLAEDELPQWGCTCEVCI